MSNADLRNIKWAFRLFFLLCAISAAIGLLVAAEVLLLGGTCGENSSIEFLQLSFLAISGCTMLYTSRLNPRLCGGLVLCGGFFICMAIRETDAWLDILCKGSWLPLALAASIACIIIARRNKSSVLPGLDAICTTRTFSILATGLAFVLVFSRIFGNKQIWGFVYSETTVRTIKNVAEESLELFGDALILTWSLLSAKALRIAAPKNIGDKPVY